MEKQYYEKINPEALINLFSQAPVALAMLIGSEFIIETANTQMLEIWGKDKSVLGLPLVEGLPEIKDQAFPEILRGVFETGKPFRGYKVSCFLERKGELGEFFFDFVYSPVYDNDDAIIGVSVVATEVTAHVVSERELAESEFRFKELLLNADYATAIYRGEDMVIELANEKMLQTWGKDQSVIGKRLGEALPELEGQPFMDILKKVYTTGISHQSSEARADLIVDGVLQTFYFNYSYKPIRNAKGEIYAILNMAVDITEMVKFRQILIENTQMLKRSEAKYKNLSEAMPQIVWTMCPDGNFTYFNERFCEYLGNANDFKKNHGLVSIVHKDDLPKLKLVWKKAMLAKSDFEMEHRIMNQQSGEFFWVLTRSVPDLDDDGKIKQWIGSSTDINEFKKLQAQKDTFLGMASHELKTPLTSIKLYAQMLERSLKKAGDEKNANFARKMDEQVIKLTSLINDLLDVTRINSGKIQLEKSSFDFSQLVKEVVAEQQLATKHTIIIESNNPGIIFADQNRISQVMNNFISNAIKYSPEASEVIVSSEISENRVKFSVKDFGIGIPVEKREKVFEQYYRVTHDSEHTFTGLGLGLYISSEIIKRSGGKIWVESELGKGSTFCFYLPMDVN